MTSKDDKDIKDKDTSKGDGTDPIKTEDSKDLTIPKHRFDEVSSELKELKAWKAEQERLAKELEDNKLKEQKKFEELAKKNEERAIELEKKYQESQINNQIQLEAIKNGLKDLDAVSKLIDKTNIKVGEGDKVDGVEEAIKNLIETRPYLKQTEVEPEMGSGTNPPDGSSKPTIKKFRLSQLQDRKFFEEHEKEIEQAMRIPGAIVDDVSRENPTPPTTTPPSSE